MAEPPASVMFTVTTGPKVQFPSILWLCKDVDFALFSEIYSFNSMNDVMTMHTHSAGIKGDVI